MSLSIFLCPSDGYVRTDLLGSTNYAGNQGSGYQAYGYNGAFALGSPVRPMDFTDGLSNTAAVSEWLIGPHVGIRDATRSVFMTPSPLIGKGQLDLFSNTCLGLDPASAKVSPAVIGTPWTHGDFGHSLYNHVNPPYHNSCLNGSMWQQGAWTAKSNHYGSSQTLFADGHVRPISTSIDVGTWRAIGSRSGGESVLPGGL
jgi:prepilin-type processing-associated H-X9-DG protein